MDGIDSRTEIVPVVGSYGELVVAEDGPELEEVFEEVVEGEHAEVPPKELADLEFAAFETLLIQNLVLYR